MRDRAGVRNSNASLELGLLRAFWGRSGPPERGRNGLIPLLNQGELVVLYCFLFLYVATHGAGIWSIDGATARARE